jgi:phosphoribosylformylglycinamidine synthase
MGSKRPRALVITGFGLNCEAETAHALERAGADVSKVHLNDILDGHDRISEYHLLAFIGGFSFGDHIAAGQVMSIKMRYRLPESLSEYIRSGNLIMGICNGFQTLCKMGVLPGFDGDYSSQQVTLTENDSGIFRDAWVNLRVDPKTRCIFTKDLDLLPLPVRHGEGKFVCRDESILERLKSQGQVVLRYVDKTGNPTMEYPQNPNGSLDAIAGICDPTGRVFGLMPHPEAFTSPYNHPQWTIRKARGESLPEPLGMRIFENAVHYIRENLVK